MIALEETQRLRRGHSFCPPESLLSQIPTLYATEATRMEEKTVWLHYFVGGCDWWIVEIDPEDALAFGYARLGLASDAEWGYISLEEMEQMVIQGFLVVERDLHWEPTPFGEIRP